MTLEDALDETAPKVWPDAASNVSFQLERGDRRSVDDAFARAASRHKAVASLSARHRQHDRAAFGDCLSGGSAAFHASPTSQNPHRLREIVADVLRMPELDLRVVSPDVGGGFGMKSQVYPEDILVLWAARKLDRPVKLVMERSDAIDRMRMAGIRSSRLNSHWTPTPGSWRCVPPSRLTLARI